MKDNNNHKTLKATSKYDVSFLLELKYNLITAMDVKQITQYIIKSIFPKQDRL